MKKAASILLLFLTFASLTYLVSRGIHYYTEQSNLEKHATGKRSYEKHCATCHQSNGEGVPGLYPPLQSSDFLQEDKHRIINVMLQGISGELIVNGKTYNGIMHPVYASDSEIADLLNYVSMRFINGKHTFTVEEISLLRELHSSHSSN
ncbi:MAG: cytochrome c [Ignavibacteria bacterium]|nr:cytochrome c [Ignavibacteria bacterium]MBM4173216.1 cytochrome c [Ignavibacteria bacterium]